MPKTNIDDEIGIKYFPFDGNRSLSKLGSLAIQILHH